MSSRSEQRSTSGPQVRESAKALVTRGENVLIVKERHADGSIFCTLPGGGVEPTESRAAALQRELYEELKSRGTVGDRVTQY
jgi:8-oxo-dGTP diphosphatase